jgi:nicotinamide-nucleotide amidase
MPENNMRQAMVPEGATIIPQRVGTAPGLICPVGDKVIYAVPGVPFELYEMYSRAILPDLSRRAGTSAVISSRVLRTWGESESGLNERLQPIINELDAIGNPTLAFLASGWEGIKVRLTAKADTTREVQQILDQWDARIEEELGHIVFGRDEATMESVVLEMLRQRGLTLAVAESVTGGLVSGRLTGVAGASDVFKGGVVSYATEVKQQLLDVPEGPVVSEEAAIAMAEGVKRTLDSSIGLALTGVAGPQPQEGQNIGTLWVGLARENGTTTAVKFTLPGARDQMRQLSVVSALNFLRLSL